MNDRGTYIELDGRPAVRFVRRYPHSVDRVWAAVTEPDGLAQWFPAPEVAVEPRPGGRITFAGDPYAPEATSEGRVLVYAPPERFAFTWESNELHFTVEPDGDGCVLTLVDVLDSRDAAARNAAGWDACLVVLDARLAGTPSGGPHDGDMAEWTALYESYVDAGLPSGAPVPDEAVPRS